MKTETEAKECWCPFSRLAYVEMKGDGTADMKMGLTAFNRQQDIKTEVASYAVGTRCVASKCMAWRWGQEEMMVETVENGKIVARERRGVSDYGYCGLAGRTA